MNITIIVFETKKECKNSNCFFLYMISSIGCLVTLSLCIVWIKVLIQAIKKWMNRNHELIIFNVKAGDFITIEPI